MSKSTQKPKKYLLINELAKQANTTKDTIRHYEQLGLLKSRKRPAGSRFYTEFDPQSIERIRTIKQAQKLGFTLKEIAKYLDGFYDDEIDIEETIEANQKKLAQIYEQYENLNVIIGILEEYIEKLKQLKQTKPKTSLKQFVHNQTINDKIR